MANRVIREGANQRVQVCLKLFSKGNTSRLAVALHHGDTILGAVESQILKNEVYRVVVAECNRDLAPLEGVQRWR